MSCCSSAALEMDNAAPGIEGVADTNRHLRLPISFYYRYVVHIVSLTQPQVSIVDTAGNAAEVSNCQTCCCCCLASDSHLVAPQIGHRSTSPEAKHTVLNRPPRLSDTPRREEQRVVHPLHGHNQAGQSHLWLLIMRCMSIVRPEGFANRKPLCIDIQAERY
jgi:hypothetical protein